MPVVLRPVLALCALALVLPGAALATSVGQLFPSNALTTHDRSQLTGLRVNLPMPNCTTNPSDCADVAVLNQLDGFNIQPRISIHFSGPIDLTTVSSHTIFLVGPWFHVVGINQIEWEPATNTLHVESDEQLAQDSTYVLVVTRGVRDAKGRPLDRIRFGDDDKDFLPMAMGGGVNSFGIAGLSVFTTQSINAISTKIRSQLHSGPANFMLGKAGERTVFPMSSVAGVQLRRQNGPALSLPSFLATPFIPTVGTLAFGTYASPNYETAQAVIPAVGTRTGVPAVQSTNQLEFTLFMPKGTAPAGGWPTAIFGHGFTDSKDGAPWAVAGSLAGAGIATVAINVVGHGGGPLGEYTVLRNGGAAPVVLPSGGRAVDQNGDGNFDSTEGVSAFGAQSLVGNRDGLRQTVVDLMQLVKVLKAGVDVDGDGTSDLSKSRIYYSGQSFGGIYGVQLLGLESDIRAGVPNVPGGPIIEIARLSPSFRILVGFSLLTRSPSLYNAVPNAGLDNFIENIPLRNLPSVVDTVPGASAIQQVIDNTEWAQQSANPAAYAPFITRPIILQFARGDMTVPNPTTSAIIRAGHLQSRTTLFRNDLTSPALGTSKNPHTFLTNIVGPGAPFAFQAQLQIATFFASDGATIIDPDGAAPFFETPTSMVPEDLAFLP